MSEYILRNYKENDYEEVTVIINQLFYPIFSPFVKLPFEKGPDFIRDFELIKKSGNEGLFVVEFKNSITGVIKLNSKEICNDGMSISLKKIFKTYGFFKVIKAFMLFKALQVKIADDEVYIDYLVVDKRHRSLGVGTKLLSLALHHAKTTKKKRLTLNVLDNNPRGRALYERFGFSFIKETKYPRFVRKRLGASADHRMEINLI